MFSSCSTCGPPDVVEEVEIKREAPIILNVYDLTGADLNKLQYAVTQTALFHAGVEVHNKEWSFGACDPGIYCVKPKNWNNLKPRESMEMGTTTLTRREFEKLLQRMKFNWLASEYNLLSNNCCNFSRSLLAELGAKPLPGWVDRGARKGTSKVTSAVTQAVCHVPHAVSRGTPVGFAAFGGELVAGQVGSHVGEALGGNSGRKVGQEVGRIGGAVGVGAAVGGVLAGPAGLAAGVATGAAVGAASYAVGKACDGVAKLIDPNKMVMPDTEYNEQFNMESAKMGFYYLECALKGNKDEALVLAVEGNKAFPGATCCSWRKKAERGQKWRFTKDGYVETLHGDLFLSVAGSDPSRGGRVVAAPKQPKDRGQLWKKEEGGYLRNGLGMYLSVSQNGGQGFKIITWELEKQAGQEWRLTAT